MLFSYLYIPNTNESIQDTNQEKQTKRLENGRITSFNGNTALVSVPPNENVAGLSPSGAPLVANDPVRSGTAYTVTDDSHLVVQVVISGQAGGIAEHSRAEKNKNVINAVIGYLRHEMNL